MQLAIADPDRYVLKPQLEGGGEMNMVFLFFFCDSSSYKHKANTRHSFSQNPPSAILFFLRSEKFRCHSSINSFENVTPLLSIQS